MSVLDGLILGVVEGVTEYLPVSSTGHLLVTQELLDILPEPGEVSAEAYERAETAADAYAIAIQGGAILAVLGLYWPRCRQMLLALFRRDLPGDEGSALEGRRLIVALIAGFLPAMVIGLLLNDLIKEHLFGIEPTVAAWIVGGVGILALSRWLKRRGQTGPDAGRQLGQITWQIALGIGLFQCVAMWPGTSRSLMTIAGALILGMSLSAAVEFSFLLGVVTLGAATAYDTLRHGELMLEQYSVASLATGFVAAFLSAAVAIKWMVGYLKQHDLAVFGWYRLVIGLIGLVCLVIW